MKKILIPLLFLISSYAIAQPSTPLGSTKGIIRIMGAMKVDSIAKMPTKDTLFHSWDTMAKTGRITIRPQDGLPYIYHSGKWNLLSAISIGTTYGTIGGLVNDQIDLRDSLRARLLLTSPSGQTVNGGVTLNGNINLSTGTPFTTTTLASYTINFQQFTNAFYPKQPFFYPSNSSGSLNRRVITYNDIDSFPSYVGQTNKYLKYNGSVLEWATVAVTGGDSSLHKYNLALTSDRILNGNTKDLYLGSGVDSMGNINIMSINTNNGFSINDRFGGTIATTGKNWALTGLGLVQLSGVDSLKLNSNKIRIGAADSLIIKATNNLEILSDIIRVKSDGALFLETDSDDINITPGSGNSLYLNNLTASSDTTANKPLGINSGGKVYKMNNWPSTGGGWSITGNSGTTAGTNFIGTTDNVPLVFKVNGLESGRIGISGNNTSFGYTSNFYNNTGTDNAAFGKGAMQGTSPAATTGSRNAAFGSSAMANHLTGNDNTAIGYGALLNVTTGNSNIAIGANAGGYLAGLSNRVILNSIDRGSGTNDSTLSILYGFQAATIADQKLRVNGKFQINDGTQGTGKVFTSDANGVGSWQTPSGGGSSADSTTFQTNFRSDTGRVNVYTSIRSILPERKAILLNTSDSIWAFGDSYTQSQGASSSPLGYINLYRASKYKLLSNQSVSARGIWRAVKNANTLLANNSKLLTVLAGLNDIRRGGMNTKTFRKIQWGLNSIYANAFSKTFADASTFSMTGTWTTAAGIAGVGGKSNTGIYTNSNGAYAEATFSGSNIALGLVSSENSSSGKVGNFSILIDGLSYGTFNFNNYTDNVGDGADSADRAAIALPIFGLSSGSHTIRLTNNSTDYLYIDYLAVLKSPDSCEAVIVGEIPYLNTTGYAISPALGSVAVTDSANRYINNSAAMWPGYPVAIAKTNMYYDTTMLSVDNIHPNDAGFRGIYQAFYNAENRGKSSLGLADSTFFVKKDGNVFPSGSSFIGSLTNTSLRFRTNNVERFVIDSLGRVGIGTASPTEMLHISKNQNTSTRMIVVNTDGGTGARAGYTASNGTDVALFDITGSGYTPYGAMAARNAYLYTSRDIVLMSELGSLKFAAGGSAEKMRIDASGNVGIGTTTPNAKLHLNQTSAGDAAALLIDNPDNDLVAHLRFRASNATRYRADVNLAAGGGLQFNAYDDIGGVYQTIQFDGNPIVFTRSGTEVMRVHTNSNVGIGTASPAASSLLDITSTTKGFLPPRMTRTQANSIASKATGLKVYSTTDSCELSWNGTKFMYLGKSGTYVPTYTSTANIASTVVTEIGYEINGDMLTISGEVEFGVTTTLTATELRISLPTYVTNNFTATKFGGGVTYNDAANNIFTITPVSGTTLIAFKAASPNLTTSYKYPFTVSFRIP